MAKIVRLSRSLSQLSFQTPHENFTQYYETFLSTDIGKLYQVIPWDKLAGLFTQNQKKKQGRTPLLDLRGQLGLMFLKAYTGYSDQQLIERLNTDYTFQFFCGIYISPEHRFRDSKIVSKIRCRLAGQLCVDDFQQVLADHWQPYLNHVNVMLSDATCYETQMRYPTNVKLLWECCQWVYGQMRRINKHLRGAMPRSKFAEQKLKYLAYQKKRKKTYKETRKRIRSLLYLLNKLLGQLEDLEDRLPDEVAMPASFYKRRDTIRRINDQQHRWFETGEKPANVILSIQKSYIRPIVRGKETRRVEFGAKVNHIQVGGINFIDHLSFDAFHEGNRLIPAIQKTQSLSGKSCTHVGADAIYATNANRKYCTANGITTGFKRKGRAGKQEKQRRQMSSILSKERSTRLEGSFGTEKEHYSLNRIRARTQQTEILWIVFGVHTANAMRMRQKMLSDQHGSPPSQQVA